MNYNTILPPFKWFVLQNFPYIEDDFDALTNWQLFCKLGKEINKVIEKTNLTGEQVENLTNAYNELKAYVDNYFENLDVQEEINEKLDEMAESGQLTDIIAQYLQLAGVLAYDTKTVMKNATNLVEGSIAKTLGNTTYKDSYGSFYKVRQVQNTDVIDDENIIALNDPDLVAEKINSVNTKPIKPITLGTFHVKNSETDKKSYLFLSTDNYNFTKIPNIELNGYDNDVFSDPFITWDKYNKQFIIATDDQSNDRSCVIVTTKDLINYDYHVIKLNYPITIGNNRFGPEFFWYNDEMYLILSVNSSGYDVHNWHTMVAKCNDLINMTFDNAFEITFDTNSDLYDPSMIYYNNKFYFTGANQNTACIEMYESNTLTGEFTQINSNLFKMAGGTNACEGGGFAVINDKLTVISEMQNDSIMILCEMTTPGVVDKQRIIKSLKDYKVGNFIVLDDLNALNVIQKLNFTYNDETNYNLTTTLNEINLTQDTTIEELTLVPNKILVINGNYNLTINNILDPFNIKKLPIIINSTKTDIRIKAYKSDTDYDRTFSYDHNIAHSKYKEFYFNYYTTSNSYDDYINRFGNLTQHTDMTQAFSQWFYGYCFEVNKVKNFAIALKAGATSCSDLKVANINANITPKIDTFVPLIEGTGKSVGMAKIGADGYIYVTATGMTVGYAYTLSGTFI